MSERDLPAGLRFRVLNRPDGCFFVAAYVSRKKVGHVGVCESAYHYDVAKAYVETSQQSRGIGAALYNEAANEACRRGKPLRSHGYQRSPQAGGAWAKLARTRPVQTTFADGPTRRPDHVVPCVSRNAGHFLDTVDGAIAWALKNVGDANDDYPRGTSSRAEAERQRKEEEVSDYVYEYSSVTKAGRATIWRAVAIPKGEDPRLWIDWDQLGTHWSFRRSGAGVYSGSGGRVTGASDTVVIEAIVQAGDIDWAYGFTSFWYYGTEQFECALNEGAKVEIVKIDGRPVKELVARANPERQGKTHCMVVISSGPSMIVRTPFPLPRWSSVLKGMTGVMREHGLMRKDMFDLEGILSFPDGHEPWNLEDHALAARLDAAFLGERDKFPRSWLYDWRDGKFELVRKPTETRPNPPARSPQPADRDDHRYRYVTDCVHSTYEDITALVESAKKIARPTFVRKLAPGEWQEIQQRLGYGPFLPITKDRLIGYYRGVFRGQPAVFLDWSAIEYVFTLDGKLGPSAARSRTS